MLKLLDRYLIFSLIRTTLLTLFILTVLSFILTLIEELEDVGKGDYQTFDALIVAAAITPYFIYQALPLAALIGSLLSLGHLINQGEWVAMRVAGYSKKRLYASVLQAGILLLSLVLVLGEWVSPPLNQYAKQLKQQKKHKKMAFKSQHGFWARDGDYFINIQSIESENHLGFTRLFELDEQGRSLKKIILTSGMDYQQDHWRLKNGRQVEIEPQRLNIQSFQQMDWHSRLSPQYLGLKKINPYQLSLHELKAHLAHYAARGEKKIQYEIAFWSKLAMPINLIALLLLALPMALRCQQRRAIGQLIFGGILIGSLFFLINRAYGFAVIIMEWPAPSILLFPILLFFIFYFVLHRLRSL